MSSVLDELSDETLLRRFNEGEAAAFEVLLRRYRGPVYNFVFRSVRRSDRAEELTQDVFLKVISRSENFEGKSKFSTWLFAIARNICIDHSRKMVFRRHKSLDQRVRTGDGEEGGSMLERVPSERPKSDREAIARQMREEMATAIDELPEDQREVFLMRQVQGMAFKDIAEAVGAPENTVKSRMRYALERLQRALSGYRDYLQELS